MSQDRVPMKYDPCDGMLAPNPNIVSDWRVFNASATWQYNPWTGQQRDECDIESDPTGEYIVP